MLTLMFIPVKETNESISVEHWNAFQTADNHYT